MLCTNDTASDEQWTLMTVVHGHRSDDQLQRAAADDAVDYQFICQSRLVIAASPSDDRPQHTWPPQPPTSLVTFERLPDVSSTYFALQKDDSHKLKFHGSSFPRTVLVASSRGCHEDATRKIVPWNLSCTGRGKVAAYRRGNHGAGLNLGLRLATALQRVSDDQKFHSTPQTDLEKMPKWRADYTCLTGYSNNQSHVKLRPVAITPPHEVYESSPHKLHYVNRPTTILTIMT